MMSCYSCMKNIDEHEPVIAEFAHSVRAMDATTFTGRAWHRACLKIPPSPEEREFRGVTRSCDACGHLERFHHETFDVDEFGRETEAMYCECSGCRCREFEPRE